MHGNWEKNGLGHNHDLTHMCQLELRLWKIFIRLTLHVGIVWHGRNAHARTRAHTAQDRSIKVFGFSMFYSLLFNIVCQIRFLFICRKMMHRWSRVLSFRLSFITSHSNKSMKMTKHDRFSSLAFWKPGKNFEDCVFSCFSDAYLSKCEPVVHDSQVDLVESLNELWSQNMARTVIFEKMIRFFCSVNE